MDPGGADVAANLQDTNGRVTSDMVLNSSDAGIGFSKAGMGVFDKGHPLSVTGMVVSGMGAVFSNTALADLEVKPLADPMAGVKAAQAEVVSNDVKEENQPQLSVVIEVKVNQIYFPSSP
jgi:hypothetical protein